MTHRVTYREASRALGIPGTTIRNWPISLDEEGLVDLDEAREYQAARRRSPRAAGEAPSSDDDSLAYHKLREQRAKADKIELANQVRRGELVEAAEVSRSLDRAVAAAQQRLLGVAASAAPHLADRPAREVERELAGYLRAALEDLAAWRPPTEGSDDET